jgi:hypothetical protein
MYADVISGLASAIKIPKPKRKSFKSKTAYQSAMDNYKAVIDRYTATGYRFKNGKLVIPKPAPNSTVKFYPKQGKHVFVTPKITKISRQPAGVEEIHIPLKFNDIEAKINYLMSLDIDLDENQRIGFKLNRVNANGEWEEAGPDRGWSHKLYSSFPQMIGKLLEYEVMLDEQYRREIITGIIFYTVMPPSLWARNREAAIERNTKRKRRDRRKSGRHKG